MVDDFDGEKVLDDHAGETTAGGDANIDNAGVGDPVPAQ
jgi:hypothetical protein